MARAYLPSLAAALAIAAGCATPPPPEWSTVEDQYVCATAGHWRSNTQQHALAVRELVRRGKVRRQYAGHIRRRKIVMGMNSC